MKKKLLLGIISSIISIGVFLVALLMVQYLNTELNDINLILNNFKRKQFITNAATVTESDETSQPMLYRIEDTNMIMILQVDADWKNGQKGMLVWLEPENLNASTKEIMENNEYTTWLLTLYERTIGPWTLYKELNINQQTTNMDSMLNSIFENNLK